MAALVSVQHLAGKVLEPLGQGSPVSVAVQDTDGSPKSGVPVYAFDGAAYTGYSATTDASGAATLSLPDGSYRFRADFNGTEFWSSDVNDCTLPGCTADSVVVTVPVTVTVSNTSGAPQSGLPVYAFDGASYTGFHATTDASGQVSLTLPEGSYRFRADINGTQFFSSPSNGCTIPGCTDDAVAVTVPVAVTVQDTNGVPQVGLPVYAFSAGVYTGYYGTTDASGQVELTLPEGAYRFRADLNGTEFWSSSTDDCSLPGCTAAAIQTTLPVTVTVLETSGAPQSGLPVYVFDGANYTGYQGTTDASGQVAFTLPTGSYLFRADLNGTQFFSSASNDCSVPGCESDTVTVTIPVTVTVQDTSGSPAAALSVYAFSGGVYTGHQGTTDASGQALFTLPQGAYRFRADRNGTEFWSAATDNCAIPGCTTDSVIVTVPVTVTVASESGAHYPDLPVYVFSGDVYTGFHGISDASGQVIFTLPEGNYRFRADYNNVPFWSAGTNDCTIPGCATAAVTIPGGLGTTTTTIDYGYDALYRVTSADYSSGAFFHYTYDRVGNRLTQDTQAGTDTYVYDAANRLTSVNGAAFTWDANGNLLGDGTSTYVYDHANRLTSAVQGADSYTFAYNGLGDRLQQTVNGSPIDYTLDLNAGLTQVLSDGTNAYLYGVSRIGEEQAGEWQYHLADALGSVRQLSSPSSEISLAEDYQPFGEPLASIGPSSSVYSFAGEQASGTALLYLRTRYYDTKLGQFVAKDLWGGDPVLPGTLNKYRYAGSNPVNLTDPSGLMPVSSSSKKPSDNLYLPSMGEWAGLAAPFEVTPSPSSAWHIIDEYEDCPPPSRMTIEQNDAEGRRRLLEQRYGIKLTVATDAARGRSGYWGIQDLDVLEGAISTIASRLRSAIDHQTWKVGSVLIGKISSPLPPSSFLFREIFGGLEIRRGPRADMRHPSDWYIPNNCSRCFAQAPPWENGNLVLAYGPDPMWGYKSDPRYTPYYGMTLLTHELGHVIDERSIRPSGFPNALSVQLSRDYPSGDFISLHSGLKVTRWSEHNYYELWADLFSNWAFGSMAPGSAGAMWKSYMDEVMSGIATKVGLNWLFGG
jgi:RHS repeat-associated protein